MKIFQKILFLLFLLPLYTVLGTQTDIQASPHFQVFNTMKKNQPEKYEQTLTLVKEHVEKNIGPVIEIAVDSSIKEHPISILVVAPTPQRNYYTLVTSGMSVLSMHDPFDQIEHYGELVVCLPANWMSSLASVIDSDADAKKFWPIDLLIKLARYPHVNNTYINSGHTIPQGPENNPYPQFNRILIHFPIKLGEDFGVLPTKDARTAILFHGVYPIFADEFDYKKRHNSDDLLDYLIYQGVSLILDVDRKSTCR